MLLRPDPATAENRSLQRRRRSEEPWQQLANTLNDVFWIWISERAIRGAEVCGQPLRFAGVSHDITARKNADCALFRTNRCKDELLSVLSHERVAAGPHRSKRVLLVDHNRDTAESLQALLEMEGHTVAVAFTGQAALEQAAQLRRAPIGLGASAAQAL
jgi:hypothetical protein